MVAPKNWNMQKSKLNFILLTISFLIIFQSNVIAEKISFKNCKIIEDPTGESIHNILNDTLKENYKILSLKETLGSSFRNMTIVF